MSFRDGWRANRGDSGLALFSEALRDAGFDFAPNTRVLEVGCQEADWRRPALSAEPTLRYTGIDWREGSKRHGTIPAAERDVLRVVYPPASFDWVVMLSTIEHVGLGRYGDPTDSDGDIRAMRRIRDWLVPGGSVYLDVPYAPAGYRLLSNKCRCYDDAALRSRLVPEGLTVRWTGYVPRAGYPLIPKPTEDDAHRKDFLYYVALWLVKEVDRNMDGPPTPHAV